jgi:hypothetical protein
MKKFFFALVLAAVFAASLAAEISLGGTGGFTYTIDNLKARTAEGYTVNQNGVPLMAEAGWKFKPFGTVPILGGVALTAGARIGRTHLETVSPPADLKPFANIKIETVPLLAFVRVDADYLYADVAAGVHFSDVDYTTDVSDLSDNATNFTYSASLGIRWTLFRILTLRAGPVMQYYSIKNFGGLTVNSMTVGGIAGFSVEF